jgi:outer membrane beta-barrel protein
VTSRHRAIAVTTVRAPRVLRRLVWTISLAIGLVTTPAARAVWADEPSDTPADKAGDGSAATDSTAPNGTAAEQAPAQADQPNQAATPASAATAAPTSAEAPAKGSALSREAAEQGEKDLFESVRVYQQRYLMKTRRLELLAGGGLTMADPMLNHYGIDGGLLYHLSERWAVGVGGSKWFGVRKDQFLQIQRDFGLFPEKSILQAGGHVEAQFSPIVGKFSSFGLTVAQVDAYVVVGGGAARTSRGEDLKPYGVIGVGARIHTARWLTISLELRDMLLREEFLDGGALLQHVFGGIKLGFWIPPSVTYQYAR